MHPKLAPGLHVLRRGDGRLQVGLDRDRAVLLPDSPPVRRELADLVSGDLEDPPTELKPLLRVPEPTVRARLSVHGFGHPAGAPMVAQARELAAGYGLGRGSRHVGILVGAGEPCRTLVDAWMQRGTPYVVVRLVEGHAVVGPFVVPGDTACLRCCDATRTDQDPSWPLLLEQYVGHSAKDRRDGAGEPVDLALAELACAWAMRDVMTYLQGRRPSTWSATLQLDPLLHDLRTTSWLRHPACGCTWTIGA